MVPKQNTGFIKDAIYLSHTSLKDFAKCPRSYYLKNIYRDPKTNFKLQIASPYITLGACEHDAIDWFLKLEQKPSKDELFAQFRNFWRKFRGKRGGFISLEEEASFGKRGLLMLENFFQNWQILEKSVPPLKFPKYVMHGDVVLIGNFDFVGQMSDGSLHIVDFKTGSKDEDSPVQLYLYAILAESNFQKPVSKMSYWYLDRDDKPRDVVLDPLDSTLEWLTQQTKQIKQAVKRNEWFCVKGEGLCWECRQYQALIDGIGEFMFSDFAFKKDIYFLDKEKLAKYTPKTIQEPVIPVEEIAISQDPTFLLQK